MMSFRVFGRDSAMRPASTSSSLVVAAERTKTADAAIASGRHLSNLLVADRSNIGILTLNETRKICREKLCMRSALR